MDMEAWYLLRGPEVVRFLRDRLVEVLINGCEGFVAEEVLTKETVVGDRRLSSTECIVLVKQVAAEEIFVGCVFCYALLATVTLNFPKLPVGARQHAGYVLVVRRKPVSCSDNTATGHARNYLFRL
jgi:hypothetical protein